MPAGRARTPRCSPPEHSEPCRESSVGKNLVGPSSPSGPGSWTTWRETSFRAPLWPDWPEWVTWELLPGWASASPQLLGSVVGRRRGTNLATLSLYCRHPWPCAVTASENWIVGTQAEPGGHAGGGTQSVAASWGGDFPGHSWDTAKEQSSGEAVVTSTVHLSPCHLSQASVFALCTSNIHCNFVS